MEDPQSLTPKQTELEPEAEAPPLVVMVPSPGMGHLIPMIEFAKRLVVHKLAVTFVIPTDGPPSKAQNTVLQNLPNSISHIFLPPVSLKDLPDDAKIETVISLNVLRSLPSLRDVFCSLTSSRRLVALVVDLFATDAFDVAKEFNVSPFVFYPSTAMALSFFFYLPELDQQVDCEFWELPEPVNIPGFGPIPGKELLDPVQDRKNDAYQKVIYHAKRYRLAEGIIENSFLDLEPRALKELQKDEPGKPPVYSVGPLVNVDGIRGGAKIHESECLKWLDEQPRGSVIFVCFGSGGTLSSAQTNELALGLEMSEQRFLWVVKSPNDKIANANFFTAQSDKDSLDFLPKGFLDRTKGRGLLVHSWAPQAQILSHGSTGGFLTHCGWNSVLESVVNGVPLVAWPLYAEQKMNAVLVTQEAKVALRPKISESGLVERHEIAKVVKDLMEGEEGKKVRYRTKNLKEAAATSLGENGSSSNQMSQLVSMWKKKATATATK